MDEEASGKQGGASGAVVPTPSASGQRVGTTAREASSRLPDVVVDFEASGELLHVVIRNIGNGPAHRVRVTFEPAFRGAGGTVELSKIALFHRLEFLAPGRELRAFVDALAAYFARGEPESVTATATFHDDGGRAYRRRVRHDLGIYRDLPQAGRSSDTRSIG